MILNPFPSDKKLMPNLTPNFALEECFWRQQFCCRYFQDKNGTHYICILNSIVDSKQRVYYDSETKIIQETVITNSQGCQPSPTIKWVSW